MQKIPYKTDQNNPAIQAYREAIETGKRDQHVFPRDHGWLVKSLLSGKAGQVFNTQKEAVDYAESNASQGTAVFIHAPTCLIAERKDY